MFLKLGGLALLGIIAFGIVTNVLPRTAVAATFQVPDVVALFETTLASRITDTATSLTLTSALTKDATSLASSTYGLIIDEGQANEELILADCTATACTNLTRGLSVITATTSVSALKQEHRRGASVKITDAPALVYAMHVLHGRQNLEYPLVYASSVSVATSSSQLVPASFVSGFANVASTSAMASILSANNTWLGTNTYSNTVTLNATSSTAKQFTVGYGPSADLEVATKKYVDDTSFSGVSNANTTTKGIVEQATVDEVNSASATGGTGASLFMTPLSFSVSNFASSTISHGYATSSTDAALYGISVDANDVLQVWYETHELGANDCQGANFASNFKIKQSTYSATTTLTTVGSGNSSTGGCSYSFFTMFTATTTESVSVETDQTNGEYSSVMYTLFKH